MPNWYMRNRSRRCSLAVRIDVDAIELEIFTEVVLPHTYGIHEIPSWRHSKARAYPGLVGATRQPITNLKHTASKFRHE